MLDINNPSDLIEAMNLEILTETSVQRRAYWVSEIATMSGNFEQDTSRIKQKLQEEIGRGGLGCLLDHLRICGVMPESYGHDSSEEKLYSKYTDVLLAIAFRRLGLTSLVLTERADAADVEVVGADYSFVADAKSFRLSRTAKNQKDFKIQAMDTWKQGKPYATVVCPLYQLPRRSSQIYQQAAARNVCVFSYSHLAVLVSYADIAGSERSQSLLGEVFQIVEALTPSKDATSYWLAVNRAMLDFDERMRPLWETEKKATLDAIKVAKEEALTYLARERETIMSLSRDEAVHRLIKAHKIDTRRDKIRSITDNGLLRVV